MARQPRSVTLHLLESLDWLLAECNVSRAALRAGVSQSTMSNNLADLRLVFNDPLLVRQGPRLVPTPRALEIVGPVRESLRRIADAVEGASEFHPERAQRLFTLMTMDYVQALMLQPLVERWAEWSSGLELAILPIALETMHEQLAAGQADVAILSPRFVPASLRQTRLFRDRFVLLAHRDHPLLAQGLDLQRYLACAHILVSPNGRRFPSLVDEGLRAIGQQRHIRVSVPQYLAAAQLVASTHLVATVPAGFATRSLARHPLAVHELPFEVSPFEFFLVWHERAHNEPAHRWLRDELRHMAARL